MPATDFCWPFSATEATTVPNQAVVVLDSHLDLWTWNLTIGSEHYRKSSVYFLCVVITYYKFNVFGCILIQAYLMQQFFYQPPSFDSVV